MPLADGLPVVWQRGNHPGNNQVVKAGHMALMLNFGKYEGKTLESVFFIDPGYAWWMEEKLAEDPRAFRGLDLDRFRTLTKRATHLKIPGPCPWCKKRPITRMFLTAQPFRESLAVVSFDCDDCAPPRGASPSSAVRPGFKTPDYYKSYDKTGGKFLVEAIKYAYFKNASYRITPKRAEEFWNNPENFTEF